MTQPRPGGRGSILYDLSIDDAVQGRDPGDVITACVDTLDPFFCNAVQRTSSGTINLVDNQLQNIGGIEASGFDLGFRWSGREASWGKLDVGFNATQLDDYTELTKNPDGSLSSTDRTGTITNETFQRAFPELKATATLDWARDRWGSGLTVRFVDSMLQESGNTLSSRSFVDIQAQYSLPKSMNSATFIVGINNVLDEDPAICDSCGVIGMSPVVHDLPGMIAYARIELDIK